MILAFYLLVFLGEYLRAAGLGGGAGPVGSRPARSWGLWSERVGAGGCRRQAGSGEHSRPGGEDAGRGTRAAEGSGRELATSRLSLHARTDTHTHTLSLTHRDITYFPQNNGFKLRQLKKKHPTLDLEERRAGRGSVARRENPASGTFAARSRVAGGGRRGCVQRLQLGRLRGSAGSHLPGPQPTPEPLPAAPLPGTLVTFLPALCPASHPVPSQMGGPAWRM